MAAPPQPVPSPSHPLRSVVDVLHSLPIPPRRESPLPAPLYEGFRATPTSLNTRYALAVASMRFHTTNEGYEIMSGLSQAGYTLAGHGCEVNETDVRKILYQEEPGVVLVQDKREWDITHPRDFRDPKAFFSHVYALADRHAIFRLTILKDAHQRPDYHRQSAAEMGVHAWVIYYHPLIVARLAPFVRPQHLIRTYHSLDTSLVPPPSGWLNRSDRCLLSGAVSGAYPLRSMLFNHATAGWPELRHTDVLRHPGYHRNGCATPAYLETLSHYKVAICTSSIYGYALRKIIEATACGCRVVTDLPTDEVLPEIDTNLVRISPESTPQEVGHLVQTLIDEYNPVIQQEMSQRAMRFYDYRAVGWRLAQDIETMRRQYK